MTIIYVTPVPREMICEFCCKPVETGTRLVTVPQKEIYSFRDLLAVWRGVMPKNLDPDTKKKHIKSSLEGILEGVLLRHPNREQVAELTRCIQKNIDDVDQIEFPSITPRAYRFLLASVMCRSVH